MERRVDMYVLISCPCLTAIFRLCAWEDGNLEIYIQSNVAANGPRSKEKETKAQAT